jgi:hypothetical protein
MVAGVRSVLRELPTVKLATELRAMAVVSESSMRMAVRAVVGKATLGPVAVMAVAVMAAMVLGMPVMRVPGLRAATVMARGMFTAIAVLRMPGVLFRRIAGMLGLLLVTVLLLFDFLLLSLTLAGLIFIGFVGGQNRGDWLTTKAGIISTTAPATEAAPAAGSFEPAFELLAGELLPLGLLLVGQKAAELFLGGLTSGMHLAKGLGSIAVALHQRAHLFATSRLNFFDRLFLFVREGKLLGHFGTSECAGTGKLQRDLLEPPALFLVQNRVDSLLAGFTAFREPLHALFAAGVAQT